MAIINGQGSQALIGPETAWGAKAAATTALNYLSESLKFVLEKKAEDTLNGGVTSREMDIMKKSVEGDIVILAKPGNIGLLIGMALGNEFAAELIDGSTGAYEHIFTPMKASLSNSLPSFTAIINRVAAAKAYVGLKVQSLKIEVTAGDYMKITASLAGKGEEAGTATAIAIPTAKAFRFAGGACSFDGTDFGDITSVSIEIKNNLDDGEQTLSSGVFGTEKQPQDREITVSFESKYSTATETIREQKYLTENTTNVVLNFISPTLVEDGINNQIQINMPRVGISECSPNVSDKGKIKLTIAGKALETASEDAVSITLVDDKATKYLP